MNYHNNSKEEILEKSSIDKETGLINKQINVNRLTYGINEFTPPPETSLWEKIKDTFSDNMIKLLMICTAVMITLSVIKQILGQHPGYSEALGIVAAILLTTTISFIQERKSSKAFESLNDAKDDIRIKVIREGHIKYVSKRDIVFGDIVFVETGDKIPADGRLLESFNLKIDESMLTGESETVSKNADVILDENTPLAERINMAYGGTYVTEGKGMMVITSVGDNTEMGKIANELKGEVEGETPLQQKLGVLGEQISKVGFWAATGIFLIEVIKVIFIYKYHGMDLFTGIQDSFVKSVALVVAAVPEGLPTMIAITLAINMEKMAKHNALVKKLEACETIGAINVICSDKTGTLTENKMTVLDVWSNGNLIKPEKLKNGYLIENFVLNSTANLEINEDKVEFIGNPTECALLSAFNKSVCAKCPTSCDEVAVCGKKCAKYLAETNVIEDYNIIRHNNKVTYQYSFSSDRKMMTTIVEKGDMFEVFTKGASEKILSLCTKVVINNEVVELTQELKEKIEKEFIKLQEQARRVIGFAHKETGLKDWEKCQSEVETDLIFDGFVGIADPLRADVYEAVVEARKAGIELKMLTGDNKITATAIAKELGIVKEDSLIYEASDIDAMSDDELKEKIKKIVVIARSKPLTKMRVVKTLKEMGQVVAVTGDGINDAPALKNADCGIAMGISGTEVSKEAADIVLLNDSFSTIVKAVNWGRGIYENFQRFIQFQLSVNVVAFLTAIIATIFGSVMPFTTLQLLWVNVIMDGPPALSLGLEKPRKHLMSKAPVKREANIITKDMFQRIITNGVFMTAMLLILMFVNPLGIAKEQMSTVIFTVFVLFQLFNAFNSREFENDSIFSHLVENKFMLLIIGVTFCIQILVTQLGGSMFRTVPLDLMTWVKITGYASTVVIFSEIVKLIRRITNK